VIVDLHSHYTPPALFEGGSGRTTKVVDGVPVYTHDARVTDVDRRVEMMDRVGIDAAYLSCGPGFHASLEACMRINAGIAEACGRHPGRLLGLAHVPPLAGDSALFVFMHAPLSSISLGAEAFDC
jgi:predicted TIM-barrel fold metal-dependent hydrolase